MSTSPLTDELGPTPNLLTRFLQHPYGPTVCVILSSICYVWMDATVQHVELLYHLPSGEIAFIRMAITFPLAMIYISRTTSTPLIQHFTSQPNLAWFRSIENITNLLLAYASYQYIKLSEAITIFHLRPIPVALLCYLFLGEGFTKVQMGACGISLAAVVLIVRPPFIFGQAGVEGDYASRLLGFGLMGASMLVGAVDVMLLRKLGKSVDVITLAAMYAMVSVLVTPLWMLWESEQLVFDLPLIAWLETLSIGIAGFGAQLGMTTALRYETGVRVALLGYLQIVFAIIVQWALDHTHPTWIAFLGMCMIISAGVWALVWGKDDEDPRSEEGYLPVSTGGRDVELADG